MSVVNLIHKSDVSFDVIEPIGEKKKMKSLKYLSRHGEIFIYQNQIFLHDGNRWYKADIQDIKEIKSLSNQKRILIHFNNFDLILSCLEHSHLLALRDYLFLAHKNNPADNLLIREAK